MKIVVTGAAGFIGSQIVKMAQTAGHEVVAIDYMLPLAHAAHQPPVGVLPLDVRKAEEWVEQLQGVDVVCHQAAVVGLETKASDFVHYASHNDVGTAALLSAATQVGVQRVVLASSMVVYGEGRYECPSHGVVPAPPRNLVALESGVFEPQCRECGEELSWRLVPEDAPLDPRSAYAASKVAQEHYCSAWARITGGSVVALRYHNVYGPGMPRNTPYAGVASLFRSAIARGEAPKVFEDGGQLRDFVHVLDIARANLAAIDVVGAQPGLTPFNVCSGHPISIAQVAEILGDTSGIKPIVTGEFRHGDVRHIVASPLAARTGLGFRAEVKPHAGIAEFTTAPLRK
jgi:dTDP-L-rhamnose 4-epimerase